MPDCVLTGSAGYRIECWPGNSKCPAILALLKIYFLAPTSRV